MKVHDEVCGMTILAEDAVGSAEFQGKTYYFCSPRCKQLFQEHPGWYVEVNAGMGQSPDARSNEGDGGL